MGGWILRFIGVYIADYILKNTIKMFISKVGMVNKFSFDKDCTAEIGKSV